MNYKRGVNHHLSKGYRKVGQGGYIFVWHNGKRVQEHRVKMEKKLGRKLKEKEYVHHLDGNPANNRISNLLLVTRAQHNRLHHMGNKYGIGLKNTWWKDTKKDKRGRFIKTKKRK